MVNFAKVYKDTFIPMLYPFGYSMWKGFFYKDINNELFVFLRIRKEALSPCPTVKSGLGIFPYCIDSTEEFDFVIADGGFDLPYMLKRIVPEKMKPEYYMELMDASNDDALLNSLRLFRNDVENFVLPYISQLADLEFLYNELMGIAGNRITSYTYGLSLKLHKYNDALVYVNNELLRNNEALEKIIIRQAKLKKVELNEVETRMLRKRPDFIKTQLIAIELDITEVEKTIGKFQVIKEALLANDVGYLDNLVNAMEEKSREYIKKWLSGDGVNKTST